MKYVTYVSLPTFIPISAHQMDTVRLLLPRSEAWAQRMIGEDDGEKIGDLQLRGRGKKNSQARGHDCDKGETNLYL